MSAITPFSPLILRHYFADAAIFMLAPLFSLAAAAPRYFAIIFHTPLRRH